MKNPLAILAGVVITSITIPILISVVSYSDVDISGSKQDKFPSKNTNKQEINYETVNKDAPIINVYNHKLGKTQSVDMEEYLYGVLSGEMPADFEIEALKAQAVAARTYVMYKQNQGTQSKHKDAVVCTDYNHCQEYKSYEELEKNNGQDWIEKYYLKIKQAVNETKGHIITYNNNPILTLYFSTSSGKTENSEEVFSAAYPYLTSVESPYDKNYSPKYVSNLKISNKDFVNAFEVSYPNLQINENNLKDEINIIERSKGGSVEKIKIGNKEIKGTDVRRILQLNSANFEINFSENSLDFEIKGFGHGVGMSQWGAEGMAQEGYKYYEILSHYYSGIEIIDLY